MTDDLAAFLDAASQQAVSLRLGHPCSCPYCDKPTPASRRDLNAADALAVLLAGWRKVLALHPRGDWAQEDTTNRDMRCGYDAERWPCATVAALVEALSPTPTPTAEETR